jgi:hypothetical protein
MLEFLNITKALAEENRLRILLALEVEELCVCHTFSGKHAWWKAVRTDDGCTTVWLTRVPLLR